MSHAFAYPSGMTVDEFLQWSANNEGKWELVDGVPQAMAPGSETHGIIQMRFGFLLTGHLDATKPGCVVLTEGGIVPQVNAGMNFRIPDLLVTCTPSREDTSRTRNPVVIVEILSPSNQAQTWINVWSFTTIDSVREIVLVRTDQMEASLLQRRADGGWPSNALPLGPAELLRLDSLEFAVPVRDIYRGTRLAQP